MADVKDCTEGRSLYVERLKPGMQRFFLVLYSDIFSQRLRIEDRSNRIRLRKL